MEVLKLYKVLLRESSKFSSYNFRYNFLTLSLLLKHLHVAHYRSHIVCTGSML